MGTSADHLAELRSNDEAAYKAHLANAQWNEWRVTIQTKAQEYKGERRLRHQVCVCVCVCVLTDCAAGIDGVSRSRLRRRSTRASVG